MCSFSKRVSKQNPLFLQKHRMVPESHEEISKRIQKHVRHDVKVKHIFNNRMVSLYKNILSGSSSNLVQTIIEL